MMEIPIECETDETGERPPDVPLTREAVLKTITALALGRRIAADVARQAGAGPETTLPHLLDTCSRQLGQVLELLPEETTEKPSSDPYPQEHPNVRLINLLTTNSQL